MARPSRTASTISGTEGRTWRSRKPQAAVSRSTPLGLPALVPLDHPTGYVERLTGPGQAALLSHSE